MKTPEPLFFESAAAWGKWLSKNHRQPESIWIQYAKKDSGLPSVTYPEALEIALCWGWIDAQVQRLDATYYLQRWSRRRPRSRWSKINREKATRLIATGQMQPAGLAEIQAAQADGRWDAAYDSPATIREPDDFLAALESNPKAKAAYKRITRSARFSLLYGILEARRSETRARRIAKAVETLSKNPATNQASHAK